MERNLLERLIAVCHPLSTAIEKAIDACPNRRDYYQQGPGTYELARDEHINRVHRLQLLQIEFEELATQISDGLEAWNAHALSAY
jgi:hypothetical protein